MKFSEYKDIDKQAVTSELEVKKYYRAFANVGYPEVR